MSKPAIIVHGGCGKIEQSTIPERLLGVKEAAQAGWEILLRHGSAVDAVEAAVVVLENNPLFNAGTGSALNSAGWIEAGAAIMDGANLAVGAVAAVTGILNPSRSP
jgi:beta-aspartyl-peptidase (threonine type)